MANAHLQTIKAAEKANKDLGALFARMGTFEHPRGMILGIYRLERSILQALAKNDDRQSAIAELNRMRNLLANSMVGLLNDAVDVGDELAQRSLKANAENVTPKAPPVTASVLAGWVATVDSQVSQAGAVISSGGDWGLVLGDDERSGIVTPAPVVRDGSRWLTQIAMMAAAGWLLSADEQKPDVYYKQAVAAIDERTTECCLRVHGQTVPMDARFRLTGTPRYADELDWSPFHWYCRTSIAMVRREDSEDDLTQQMRRAARSEIVAREDTGQRQEIHPAHATSGRGRGG